MVFRYRRVSSTRFFYSTMNRFFVLLVALIVLGCDRPRVTSNTVEARLSGHWCSSGLEKYDLFMGHVDSTSGEGSYRAVYEHDIDTGFYRIVRSGSTDDWGGTDYVTMFVKGGNGHVTLERTFSFLLTNNAKTLINVDDIHLVDGIHLNLDDTHILSTLTFMDEITPPNPSALNITVLPRVANAPAPAITPVPRYILKTRVSVPVPYGSMILPAKTEVRVLRKTASAYHVQSGKLEFDIKSDNLLIDLQ